MSSSAFKVKDTESDKIEVIKIEDTESEIKIEIDVCEENGILSHSEGEFPKDHTYSTKEPVTKQDAATNTSLPSPCFEELESPKKKKALRGPKSKQMAKKNEEKEEGPDEKAEVVLPKKGKGRPKKQAKVSESKDAEKDSNAENELKETPPTNTHTKPTRRGIKRKIEPKDSDTERKEKENVLEEVQNISGSSKKDEDIDEPPRKKNARNTKKVTPKKESPKKEKPKRKVTKSPPKKETKSEVKTPKKHTVSLGDEGVDQKNLPKGWLRKTVVRQSGVSAGQIDIYIYSPDGIKFRSRVEVQAYLAKTKSNLKIDQFEFSKKNTGLSTPAKLRVAPTPKKKKAAKPKKAESEPKKKTPTKPAEKKSGKLVVKIKNNVKKTKATRGESPKAAEKTTNSRGRPKKSNKKK